GNEAIDPVITPRLMVSVCRCVDCRSSSDDVNITVFGRERWERRERGDITEDGCFATSYILPDIGDLHGELDSFSTADIPFRSQAPGFAARLLEGDIPRGQHVEPAAAVPISAEGVSAALAHRPRPAEVPRGSGAAPSRRARSQRHWVRRTRRRTTPTKGAIPVVDVTASSE
ncbi:MAG: hypothetical protein GY811_16785, partial [Myxococcales bacterium]|nr:hypothetical protein [Myxococcales bacterium]